MMKWPPWPPSTAIMKKFHVKVKPLKLEVFDGIVEKERESEREKIMVIEMNWKGPKPGLIPFHRTSKKQRNVSSQRILKKGESIEWNDEFNSVCSFSIVPKDNSFAPWDVSFYLLYGEGAESKAKLAVVGKVSLNLAELASKMESQIEKELPITLQLTGVTREATLLVSVTFVEIRNSQDSLGIVQNATESNGERGFISRVKDQKGHVSVNKNDTKKHKSQEDQVSPGDSDESATFDSEGTPENDKGWSPSSETQLDPVRKVGFLTWKRRRLSFRPATKKGEPLIKNTSLDNDDNEVGVDRPLSGPSYIDSITSVSQQKADATEPSSESEYQDENRKTVSWELMELVSRDGQAKLKTNVFFASFDQRSKKADGQSACTALVTVMAHWLQSNQDMMPTRSQFDNLITEGSYEWQKLCDDEVYVNRFPDKHFDLETVLQADLRPLSVMPEKSFVGFFCPEKFESLKGAMSFDEIWNEISSYTKDYEPRVYIVSWNDHFFVLKAEADAYYIIDTLGERLFEGCNQAYILKFDNSASMYGKTEKEEVSSEEMAGAENTTNHEKKKEEIICSGKDCCREFIKRFLAAIPLGELEAEEKKGTLSYFSLHQRLQIEFHFTSSFCTSSSSSSSSSASSTCSLFSNEEYTRLM